MTENSLDDSPTAYPFMHYEDAPAAIDWLERAFGFSRHYVVPGPDGTIAHAQIRVGRDMIMIGSARENPLGLRTPISIGGAVTGGVYVFVADADAHFDGAKAAGATIVQAPHDTDYGSREYTVRDPEGHLWSFGTYRPETAPSG